MKKLINIDNIYEYLEILNKEKNRFLIILTVQGEWWKYINNEIANSIIELGCKTDLSRKSEISYLAIIKNGILINEFESEKRKIIQYRLEVNDINFNIISVSKYAKFVKNSNVSVGISTDSEQLTIDKNGLSIVVYDEINKIVIDALTFDTSTQNFNHFRLTEYSKVLADKITELNTGFGYTIAQWLYDNDLYNITIIVDSQFPELIKLVTLPIKMNDKITVNNYFTSSTQTFKLNYTFNRYFFPEVYIPLDLIKIKQTETVIYISPYENNNYKDLIEKVGANFFTIEQIIKNAFAYIGQESALLKLVSENPDVKVMLFSRQSIKDDNSIYSKNLINRKINIRENRNALKNNKMDSEMLCDYIKNDTNFTREDWLEMVVCTPESINDEYGYRKFIDRAGKCINILKGHRLTAFQPEIYDNTIYIFGGCNIFGVYCTDNQTLPSQLQKLINEKKIEGGKKYRVENYGHLLFHHWTDLPRIISSIKPKKGDILICQDLHGLTDDLKYKKFPKLDLSKISLPKNYGILFCDAEGTGHASPNLHRFTAEKIFEYMMENNFFKCEKVSYKYKTLQIPICGIQQRKVESNTLPNGFIYKLNNYKNNLRILKGNTIGKIGAIVMNCNPFTLGHRYLIEYASKKVKHLFIFLVEEDRSIFPFKDRFNLVKSGTEDLKNLTILPSGEFIISSLTFSEYFQKSSIQDRIIDPTLDVELFAKEIAPTLGIDIRFAGEEPLDNITSQYNDAMKRILPQYGIEFEVISRKENKGEVISASRVRKLLEINDFDNISKLVPESTLLYLKKEKRKEISLIVKENYFLKKIKSVIKIKKNMKKANSFKEANLKDIHAKCILIMDTNTDKIIYAKNENVKEIPASIVKILTCIIALEHGCLEAFITIPAGLTKVGSIVGIQPGEKITLLDMLYGMMLPSGNDLAEAIAIYISGSIYSFVDEMNKLTKKLSMENSHFSNPNGINESNTYSTAFDMSLAMRYAINNTIFRKIISTPVYKCTSLSGKSYTFENTNALIYQKKGYYNRKYDACIGGKTGQAGGRYCLISIARKNEQEHLLVQMAITDDYGTDKGWTYRFSDAVKIHEWAFSNNKLSREKCDVNRNIDIIKLHSSKITTKFIYESLGLSLPDKSYVYNFMKFAVDAGKNDIAFILDITSDPMSVTSEKRSFELSNLAIKNGASLLVTTKQIKNYHCLVVNNVFKAYTELCTKYRENYKPITIAITGSIGKTTTTQFISNLIKDKWIAHSNQGTANNVRYAGGTIQDLKPEHKFYIQEIMEGPPYGAAGTISKMVKPNAAVITKVGTSHIEFFGSQERILESCLSIQDGMPDDGVLFLNGDDEYLINAKTKLKKIYFSINNNDADYKAINICTTLNGIDFDVVNKQKTFPIHINFWGEHNVYNALAACTVAKWAGMSDTEIQKAICKLRPEGIRQNMFHLGGYSFYLDCYNAAPESMVSSLKVLTSIPRMNRESKRIAVLADMLELGTYSINAHKQIGGEVAISDIDILICYGIDAVNMAETARSNEKLEVLYTKNEDELIEILNNKITKNDIVLFKGSHTMKLELVIDKTYGTWFHEEYAFYNKETEEIKENDYEIIMYPHYAKIKKYYGSIENVAIPKNIKSRSVCCIDKNAFYENNKIKTIALPDSIRNIRYCAFYKCNGLTTLNLPADLKVLDRSAFSTCENLCEVNMCDKVVEIGYRAFGNCKNLQKINIPPSVGNIGEEAFLNCSQLTIYCQPGSYAEEYAKKNDINFSFS